MGYITHDFYCTSCGKKAIPLMRKAGHQHARMHLKKLYCPFCQKVVNHVECRTQEDVATFLENFNSGAYKNQIEFAATSWEIK